MRRTWEPSEAEIQRTVLDWAKLQDGIECWRVNVIGTPMKRGDKTVFRRATNPGMADLICQFAVHGVPVLVFLECKRPSKRAALTDNQKQFKSRISYTGGHYYIVSSIEDTVSALEDVRTRTMGKLSEWMWDGAKRPD